MAKAADIEVQPDEPYAHAAARIVRVRADELFEQAEGVLDTSDIERVHDMRVASRRLRAVLEVFAPCFPRGPYRGVLRDVKMVADALGERRDPDVHLAAMEKLAAELPAELQPGIEELAERQRERQAVGNEVLAPALEDMERTDLRGRLHALADAAEALA
jgi:CHAD domain-containing protein